MRQLGINSSILPSIAACMVVACGTGNDAVSIDAAGSDGGATSSDARGSQADAGFVFPTWVAEDSGTSLAITALGALATEGADVIVAVTDYPSLSYASILEYDGTDWSRTGNSGDSHGLFGVTVIDVNDVWVVGGDAFGNSGLRKRIHSNGTDWNHEKVFAQGGYSDVFGVSADVVWATGSRGTIDFWNGTTWTEQIDVPGSLYGVWASSASSAWAVGGDIYFWDGIAWEQQHSGALVLSIWGLADNDIWAVGRNGKILHFDGTQWETETLDESYTFRDVWMASSNDVWAVGDKGLIVHFDGSSWTRAPIPTGTESKNFYTVAGTSPDNVWIGGSGGLILRKQ